MPGSRTWARRMWAYFGDDGEADRVESPSKSGSSCSLCSRSAGRRCPGVRPMVNSLATRSAASQFSSSMRMRRSTRVVPPAATPGRAIHTARSKSAGPAGLTVPSSWPMRLRWVVPGLLGPCGRGGTRAGSSAPVAKQRASLRSCAGAWATVTASSAQICSSRSPPLQRWSSLSIVNAGSGATSRPPVLRSGGGEQARAEAEGDGQPGRQRGQFRFGVGQGGPPRVSRPRRR